MFFLRDLEEAAAPADRYGLLVGLPAAATALLNEQMHYSCSHGIGIQLTQSTVPFFWQLSFLCATAITREDFSVEKKEIKTSKKPALFRLFFIIEVFPSLY
jgi:hypothetical protein